MVASANDYRTGDGNCYTSYTGDGGRTWQDSTPPTSFTRGQVAERGGLRRRPAVLGRRR